MVQNFIIPRPSQRDPTWQDPNPIQKNGAPPRHRRRPSWTPAGQCRARSHPEI